MLSPRGERRRRTAARDLLFGGRGVRQVPTARPGRQGRDQGIFALRYVRGIPPGQHRAFSRGSGSSMRRGIRSTDSTVAHERVSVVCARKCGACRITGTKVARKWRESGTKRESGAKACRREKGASMDAHLGLRHLGSADRHSNHATSRCQPCVRKSRPANPLRRSARTSSGSCGTGPSARCRFDRQNGLSRIARLRVSAGGA